MSNQPHSQRPQSLARAALLVPASALLNAYPLHELSQRSLEARSAGFAMFCGLAAALTAALCCAVLFRFTHDLREGCPPWRKALTAILLLLAATFPLLTSMFLVLGMR